MLYFKLFLATMVVVAYGVYTSEYVQKRQVEKTEKALTQLSEEIPNNVREDHVRSGHNYLAGWIGVAFLLIVLFSADIAKMIQKYAWGFMAMAALFSAGCYRPFEPVKLEVISSNEEAFLLPYTGDSKKQQASDNEAYLKSNLVYTKQVQIPQQWVPAGYETIIPNGEWRDAAILVKVDKSPVTREWTADTASGTSTKNEAIWVMTSDQVEFSTGWTCTARIASREDAIKFLHNYPNGSLTKVLDSEVRAKIQADFGLEVTDLPMDTLRKAATPHITKIIKDVTEFFKERGITITNLGITGGFVYKDKTILETMVKVFNAEQEKSIAMAETAAQEERNKKVIFEATGKADALLKTKKSEAEGIKLVADAKLYEIEKSMENAEAYFKLKQIELQKDLLMKWDGSYPKYFMGSGNSPNMLLQLPTVDSAK